MMTTGGRATRFLLLAAAVFLTPFGPEKIFAQSAASTGVPDIAGIRPGMTAQQAYEALKARAHGAMIGIGQNSIDGVTAKPVPMTISVRIPDRVPAEVITVYLTTPPSKQVVWAVAEQLTYDDSNKVLTSVVVDALRKKFGPEMSPAGYNLWWGLDHEGKHAVNNLDCIGYQNINVSAMEPSGPTFSTATALMYGAGPASPCDALVAVRASTISPSNGSPYSITILVSEVDHSLVLSSRQAYKAYVTNAGARQQQQELEKAKQQNAPTF